MSYKVNDKQTLEDLIAQLSTDCRTHPSDEEHRIQTACVRWFSLKHRKLKGRLFAVPNGGKRDNRTAIKLKEEGVVAGVSDLILLVPNKQYGALLIEMKTLRGKQSASQKQWEELVTANSEYKYIVCQSLDEFIKEVEEYLKLQK